MKPIIDYLLTRLTERSTWVGLTGLLTALGVTLSPEHAASIATVGAAVAGAIQTFVNDRHPAVADPAATTEADAPQ